VLYEGVPADFIIFVKKGLFEITRTFDEDNCFLSGTKPTEALSRANNRTEGTHMKRHDKFTNDTYAVTELTK